MELHFLHNIYLSKFEKNYVQDKALCGRPKVRGGGGGTVKRHATVLSGDQALWPLVKVGSHSGGDSEA